MEKDTNDCQDPAIGEELLFFIAGEISLEKKANFEEHLRICQVCRDELALLKEGDLLLRTYANPSCPSPQEMVDLVSNPNLISEIKRNKILQHVNFCADCKWQIKLLNKHLENENILENENKEKATQKDDIKLVALMPESLRATIDNQYNKSPLKFFNHKSINFKSFKYQLLPAMSAAMILVCIGLFFFLFRWPPARIEEKPSIHSTSPLPSASPLPSTPSPAAPSVSFKPSLSSSSPSSRFLDTTDKTTEPSLDKDMKASKKRMKLNEDIQVPQKTSKEAFVEPSKESSTEPSKVIEPFQRQFAAPQANQALLLAEKLQKKFNLAYVEVQIIGSGGEILQQDYAGARSQNKNVPSVGTQRFEPIQEENNNISLQLNKQETKKKAPLQLQMQKRVQSNANKRKAVQSYQVAPEGYNKKEAVQSQGIIGNKKGDSAIQIEIITNEEVLPDKQDAISEFLIETIHLDVSKGDSVNFSVKRKQQNQ